jgi:hypothetical protein
MANGTLELLQLLCDTCAAGAISRAAVVSGEPPLHCAVKFGDVEVVEWMVGLGANVLARNVKEHHCTTALVAAQCVDPPHLRLSRGRTSYSHVP